MNVAVSGAGGFLGSNLIYHCMEHSDIHITALSSKKEILAQKFQQFSNRLDIINMDEYMDIAWDKIDILVHCAFPRNADSIHMATGLKFTADLLTAAVRDGVGAVINISSQSVYSQARVEAATETTPLNLESSYAVGKYATELITNSVCKNIPHSSLRMASLIGVEFNQRIVNKLVADVVNGRQIAITGGNQKFGFFDVRDAAAGIVVMLKANVEKWAETYNFGTNTSFSLFEIAELVHSAGLNKGYQALIPLLNKSDCWQNSSLVCDLFNTDFTWNPVYNLEDTISSIFDYFENRAGL